MSKIFFDHLVKIKKIKHRVSNIAQSHEEKEDLWQLIDEYVNRKIIMSILENIDQSYHEEFISVFLERPYDIELIEYLNQHLTCSLCELIEKESENINKELCEIMEISLSANIQKKDIPSSR